MIVSMLFFFWRGGGLLYLSLSTIAENNVIFAMPKGYVWSGAFHGIMTSFGIFYKNLKLVPFAPLIVSMLTCKSRIVPEINSCSLSHSFEFSAVDVKEKSKQLKWGHKQLLEEEPLPG